MKELLLFTGLGFYIGAGVDTKLGMFVFLFWIVAFSMTWLGWGMLFSILCLISSASYKYTALESSNALTAVVLPWVFGISVSIVIFSIVFKYAAPLGTKVDSNWGFWGDGGSD